MSYELRAPPRALEESFTVATAHWHALADSRTQCDICPRACRLHEGQRGLCFVRARQGEKIVLTSHGRSSGFCIDPIEKKPLNHFLPGTPVLSFGTAGCMLACKFCQNWDISKSREVDTMADAATPDRIADVALALGCRSVAFTYNDPVVFHEYAIDVADACRALGLRSVAVTAGYQNAAPRAEFYAHMDAANVDLKAFTDTFYHDICAGRLQPVLETLEYVKHETNVWLEITNLVIPGLNDSDAEFDAMTRWIVERLGPDVPVHFTALHPDWKMLDWPPTPAVTLARARLPSPMVCATPTPAMCATPRARRPAATSAARRSSSATAMPSAPGASRTTGAATAVARAARACSPARPATGERGGARCA
jgi:pyruvate formate lyase activating enzyme